MSFFRDDEETLEEPYGEIWRHLDLSLEKVAERERRQEAAGELFAELTGAPLESPRDLLRQVFPVHRRVVVGLKLRPAGVSALRS